MDEQKLRSQLEQLHTELGQINTLDQVETGLLQELSRDIREALRRGDDRGQQYGGLVENLREAVARLEASHSNAALLMRQVIDELAYMGI